MPLNCSMTRVRNSKFATNISELQTPQKGDGKPFASTLLILRLVTQMMSLVSTGPNPERSRKRRRNRSQSPSLGLRPHLGIPIMLISMCGVVQLEGQGPFLLSFRLNQWGHGLAPFVDFQLQRSTNILTSPSGRVTPAENTTTSVKRVPTPRALLNNNLSYLPRNELGPSGESPQSDIEDKYSMHMYTDFDHDRFTENYFEYEQGQKDIIMKNRLRNHFGFWEKIGANQFILDTILHGYKIPFYSLPPRFIAKNNMSVLKESSFVQEAISDLLDRGLIQECDYVPVAVNPLTVSIQSNGKKPLILALREVNKHVLKQKIKYEDLRIAPLYLQKGSWMIKFDICSAYHFIDIRLPDTEYLAFSFPDKIGVMRYYKFLVWPFGLGVALYIWTKLTRPLIAKWREEGLKIIMFLDDGFGAAETLSLAEGLSQQVKKDLLDSGFIPKADKCIWTPVQALEWLGALLNSADFTISIPQRRIDKAILTLRELCSSVWVPVRKAASFVGQIISMSIVIGPVSQIMTRCISINILQARTWNSYIKLTSDSQQQLTFWENTLVSLKKRSLSSTGSCSKIVYSDASGTGYAGYEVGTINGVSRGTWTVEEAVKSST